MESPKICKPVCTVPIGGLVATVSDKILYCVVSVTCGIELRPLFFPNAP